MTSPRIHAIRGAVLALTLAAGGIAGAAELDRSRATVLRAEAGQSLAAARIGADPAQAVAAVLRARGHDAAALRSLRPLPAQAGRAGMRHLRFEQQVDGLVVHGRYAKAAIDANGRMVQLIDRLARVPAVALPPARIDALAALQAAMARLHPRAAVDFRTLSTEGRTTLFDGGGFFAESPRVTAVAVPVAGGALERAWMVQTWTGRGNLLHHTLVGGDGRILDVELRTNSDSYNVFTNAPDKTPQAVVAGPGPGNAESPIGWLSGNFRKTTNLKGNNVQTYLDSDANNRPDAGGSFTRSQDFLAPADLASPPTTPGNKLVAVQNLFYLNNVIHDILYRHGFDEAAFNFQTDNFGNGGAGNDPVRAEAQDGAGTDNANFATPPDGQKPRMQMFLWTGSGPTHEVAIASPVAVTYLASGASFGAPLDNSGLNGAIAAAVPADGCTPVSGVAGSIAIIDRGACNFTVKVKNAQLAGAVGAIVANNVGGTEIFALGGTDATITIPAVMIGQNDGAALRALAAPAGTMRLKGEAPLQVDASLDSDIVYHEYGHGLTWRMIGNMSGPLAGALGEGASDSVAILVNGDPVVAEYSSGRANGIRRASYAGYPNTYGDVVGTSVHADGEIYAAVIWRLIEAFGPARRADLLSYFVDGMNYIPAGPAYEDMRDGMLQAVANGPAPGDRCTVWTAFAAGGIGVGASGTVSGSTVSIVESFAVPADCAP